jgi:hypothetical protein
MAAFNADKGSPFEAWERSKVARDAMGWVE